MNKWHERHRYSMYILDNYTVSKIRNSWLRKQSWFIMLNEVSWMIKMINQIDGVSLRFVTTEHISSSPTSKPFYPLCPPPPPSESPGYKHSDVFSVFFFGFVFFSFPAHGDCHAESSHSMHTVIANTVLQGGERAIYTLASCDGLGRPMNWTGLAYIRHRHHWSSQLIWHEQ